MYETWVPDEVGRDKPAAARVYDFLLGGAHHFAVDRELGERVLAAEPDARRMARVNREFLGRVVRELVALGVRQFVDLGSGIPTRGNVHSVAQASAPDTRVVYVDADPVAVAHSRAILSGNDLTGVVQADIRHPERILADPQYVRLIDPGRPVAVLMLAVLPFVRDADNPAGIIGTFRRVMAPGSFLVISHAAPPGTPGVAGADERATAKVVGAYAQAGTPLALRSRAEVSALFAGFELLAPGVVDPGMWRPEPGADPLPVPGFAGVGVLR